jgi:hypothetical protein
LHECMTLFVCVRACMRACVCACVRVCVRMCAFLCARRMCLGGNVCLLVCVCSCPPVRTAEEASGDVLVFLPGQEEIENVATILADRASRLSVELQKLQVRLSALLMCVCCMRVLLCFCASVLLCLCVCCVCCVCVLCVCVVRACVRSLV